MFSLVTLLVHEKEHGLISRGILENDSHYLKQSLAQSGGTTFRNVSRLRIKDTGLESRGVNVCKSNESFLVMET